MLSQPPSFGVKESQGSMALIMNCSQSLNSSGRVAGLNSSSLSPMMLMTFAANCTTSALSELRIRAPAPAMDDHGELPEPPMYVLVSVSFIYTLIFLLGVVGNVLVIMVVLRNPDMKNSTNFFLLNLSVADLLVIVVCMPSAFIDLYTKEVWLLGPAMCKIVPYLENTVASASVLTILAISFERYYAICRPLKAQYTCTFQRMLKVVATVWLVSLATCSAFMLIPIYKDSILLDGTPVKVCRTYIRHAWQVFYLLGMTVGFFVGPFFVLVSLYCVIGKKLVRDTSVVNSKNDRISHANLRARKQVVLMLFAVVVIFFVCLLPINSVRICALFGSGAQKLGFEGYLNLTYFSRVMFYFNSVLNPVVYSMLSTKFRDSFKRALGMHKMRRSGRASLSIPASGMGSVKQRPISSHGSHDSHGSQASNSSGRKGCYQACSNCSHEGRPKFLMIRFTKQKPTGMNPCVGDSVMCRTETTVVMCQSETGKMTTQL